jgi:type I restriction enzyme S subunit
MTESLTQKDYSMKREWMRYPKYKDSGVEWLGEIPEGWKLARLKFNSFMKGRIGWQNLRSDEFTDIGPFLITGMHFKSGSVDWDSCFHITEERYNVDSDIQVKNHDLLITKDGSIGKLAYIENLPGKASLNSHLLLVRPLRADYLPRFMYFELISDVFVTHILNEQKGTTFNGITQESISNFSAILPPITEQTAIATFLDRETARIDALIEKKEHLIALLEEKRVALISHAVTKGLDPDTKMKDSGVEWIGMVPEGWNVIHLKRTFEKVDYGISGNFDVEGKYGILTMGNIQDGEIIFNKLGYTDSLPADLLLNHGDLVFNRTNSLSLVGKVGIFRKTQEDNISLASYLVRIRLKAGHDPEFFNFLLNCEGLLGIARSLALPSIGQANLNPNRYGHIRVVVPFFEEQKVISEFLTYENKQIERLIERIKCSISSIQEYRSTLISAAVTGKIDVRQEAIV